MSLQGAPALPAYGSLSARATASSSVRPRPSVKPAREVGVVLVRTEQRLERRPLQAPPAEGRSSSPRPRPIPRGARRPRGRPRPQLASAVSASAHSVFCRSPTRWSSAKRFPERGTRFLGSPALAEILGEARRASRPATRRSRPRRRSPRSPRPARCLARGGHRRTRRGRGSRPRVLRASGLRAGGRPGRPPPQAPARGVGRRGGARSPPMRVSSSAMPRSSSSIR